MTKLLTSVRNLDEARAATVAGSDWVDLKDPQNGSLGAVEPSVATEVVGFVNGQRADTPISATLGDLWHEPAELPERAKDMQATGVDYLKFGVYADVVTAATLSAIEHAANIGSRLIAVCFAERPPSLKAIQQLSAVGCVGLMLDTADKSSGSLTELMTLEQIRQFVSSVRSRNCLVGLAGSLSARDAEVLCALDADYLGFRGALCEGAQRNGTLSPERVRRIKQILQQAGQQHGRRDAPIAGAVNL